MQLTRWIVADDAALLSPLMTQSTLPPAGSDTHTASDDDPREGGEPITLLHVEPDAGSTELLAELLAAFAPDSSVRSADGMAAALDTADAVDCIVTEQRLPDGSGVELLERLHERGIDIPVVFYTTCRDAETEVRALNAGADAYFSKRPERGQYYRLIERLRDLVDESDESDE